MKRKCTTCGYMEYKEEKAVMGYQCTLCGKYIEGIFATDKEVGLKPSDYTDYKGYIDHCLAKRETYRHYYPYWCPLIKHKNTKKEAS